MHSSDTEGNAAADLHSDLMEAAANAEHSSQDLSLREIFDSVCRNDPDSASRISYSSVRRSMFRRRLANRPQVPDNAASLDQAL